VAAAAAGALEEAAPPGAASAVVAAEAGEWFCSKPKAESRKGPFRGERLSF
jgi:hypothetical protein